MLIINFSQKPGRILKIFVLLSFACFGQMALAEDQQSQEIREQQKDLRELLDRIGETQDQRKDQRATLKKLEKQMSCNWALIQDYENCEKQFKDNLEAHVKCKHEAKEKASQCLNEASE